MSGLDIITCPQWHAKDPRSPIVFTPGPAVRILFHHTAGHHREIAVPADESFEEAIRYAQDIQTFHMAPEPRGRHWIDSGHNFLVTRAGQVLQGRWKTVQAIEDGRMVVSAHCPGQNDQIGIEHEHKDTEPMTGAQREASALLMAWIAHQYSLKKVLPVYPHRKYYRTSCPANLTKAIPDVVKQAQSYLDGRQF